MSASLIRSPFTLSRSEPSRICTPSHRVVLVHTSNGRRSALSSKVKQTCFRGQSTIVHAEAAQAGTDAAPAVNDGNWKELVLESSVPVIVDFWAPWCGPCRMIAPLIDELAVEYGDKIKAFKLNTDESPGVAAEYGIRSIPTVMIFKDGTKMDTVIGAVPKTTLTQTLEKYL